MELGGFGLRGCLFSSGPELRDVRGFEVIGVASFDLGFGV